MFESLRVLKGGWGENCARHGSGHATAKIIFKHGCLAPPSIGPMVTLVEDEEARAMVTRANASDSTRSTGESGTHTFGEIGSKVFVQLVKVGFGDDDRVQRGVISTLVRRTLWLECAVLIAGNSRVGGSRWGGRCAGGARRPLHGVHSASRGREGRGTASGWRADEMRRPVSVNTLAPASIREGAASLRPVNSLLKSSIFSRNLTFCTHGLDNIFLGTGQCGTTV